MGKKRFSQPPKILSFFSGLPNYPPDLSGDLPLRRGRESLGLVGLKVPMCQAFEKFVVGRQFAT
jgi:hypothetical protein